MIGRKLHNRYEIQEHLGDGSTATVYKAMDLRLRREVALKVLLPHVRETTRKRFFQEATAAAQLNHPNIMAIFDMDEEDGQNYLVVEYVEGVPLSYYIPSPPDVVVTLGQQIALALQYAHDHFIIHRDIKPANIKVTPDGQVKIMDLGLALPREATRVTADGMVIGTPAYLSPEQAQGLKLDHRTDIYSLGVVLYEMATGQLPFDADDITALLLQQVKQPPPPPRLVAPGIPVPLESVILKTLEKNPVKRFQTCRALSEALGATIEPKERLLDTLQTEAVDNVVPPPSPHYAKAAKRTLRVVLADDHTILRKTLVSFLEGRDEFVVIGEAGTGEEALQQANALLPDVLVLDMNMPGKSGLDILPQVRKEAPSVKVLVLTGRAEEWYIMQALRAGAHGYVLKSADESQLIDALNKVAEGQLVLGTGVAEKIVTGMLKESGDRKPLSTAEQQILLHVAAGHENDVIAKLLQISQIEVIETLASAMDKLGAKDRHAAALVALRNGEIKLEDVHTV